MRSYFVNRYFLYISYNGKNYHGWQNQPNANSIQNVIEKNLSILLKEKIEITGAGRTDTGVHAPFMVAHFDTEKNLTEIKTDFIFKLNRILPNDISVFDIKLTSPVAHARFDAISRTYEYKLHQFKNPFLTESSYYLYGNLNFEAMNEACEMLLSQKDFASFCKSNTDVKSTLCNVTEAKWRMIKPNEFIFTISANRFLRNMVRAIVGTLIEVGQNKISLKEFKEILNSKNRSSAGQSVPGHALYLTHIQYPEHLFIH